jgi:hypothetical protein
VVSAARAVASRLARLSLRPEASLGSGSVSWVVGDHQKAKGSIAYTEKEGRMALLYCVARGDFIEFVALKRKFREDAPEAR